MSNIDTLLGYDMPTAKPKFSLKDRTRRVIDRVTKESLQANPWRNLIEKTEKDLGIPPGLYYSILKQESKFNPNTVSPSGAEGIAQIVRKHHPTVKNPFDPNEAIPYGGKYLKDLHSRFKDWRTATAAYNAGPTYIAEKLRRGDKSVPRETQKHWSRVSRYQGEYNTAVAAPQTVAPENSVMEQLKKSLRGM